MSDEEKPLLVIVEDDENADWIITLQRITEAAGGPISDATLMRQMAEAKKQKTA